MTSDEPRIVPNQRRVAPSAQRCDSKPNGMLFAPTTCMTFAAQYVNEPTHAVAGARADDAQTWETQAELDQQDSEQGFPSLARATDLAIYDLVELLDF